MEIQFENSTKSYLTRRVSGALTKEETQEIRLTESMPDIGRVLGCWGEILIRSKEWHTDSIRVSGGVLTWVLYIPEDGHGVQCVEGWLPFQMKWDMEQTSRDGFICVRPLVKSIDCRSTSARKLMVRCCVSVYANALEPAETEIPVPSKLDPDIQLLTQTYPMELPVEYGEKEIALEETQTLTNSQPPLDKIIRYKIDPKILEYKIMANRLVFRGSAALKLLYCGKNGEMENWEVSIPFSQFTELDRDHSSNSSAEIAVAVTGLEVEPGEDGKLSIKCSLAIQYVIYDREMICFSEDAYSTNREVQPIMTSLHLPSRLDERTEYRNLEQHIPGQIQRLLDADLRLDHPQCKQQGDRLEIEQCGQFQAIYLDSNGVLQSMSMKSEDKWSLDCSADSKMHCYGNPCPDIYSNIEGEGVALSAQLEVSISACAGYGMSAVQGLEIGESKKPDGLRPSVILRRAGEDRLWDIAKEYGSTVASIMDANHLQNDPISQQILLIPIS